MSTNIPRSPWKRKVYCLKDAQELVGAYPPIREVPILCVKERDNERECETRSEVRKFYAKEAKIEEFRDEIEQHYKKHTTGCGGSFGEILCYELHSQPVNPRMNRGELGLTFRELAGKWAIDLAFLGELIADHCRKLEE